MVNCLYGYQREILIRRGIKESWKKYTDKINLIEDEKKRDKKIKGGYYPKRQY